MQQIIKTESELLDSAATTAPLPTPTPTAVGGDDVNVFNDVTPDSSIQSLERVASVDIVVEPASVQNLQDPVIIHQQGISLTIIRRNGNVKWQGALLL